MSFIITFVSSIKRAVQNVLTGTIPDFEVTPKDVRVIKDREIELDQGLFIIVGMTGRIKGRMIYRINEASGLKLASRMMMTDLPEMDDLAYSALAELTNMISGNTLSSPDFQELNVDISPPTLFQGRTVSFRSLKIDVIQLAFEFDGGSIDMFIAIEE